MTEQRLAYIDALRGFAILGVILTHVAPLAGVTGPVRLLTNAGGAGVQLFFVISAFTIFMTFERSVSREASPLRNFFVRRFLRIVPVYWFGILVYTLVYGLDSRGFKEGPEPWHYLLHLTLTNVLHPLTTTSVVPGGWSISVEVLFYATVPLWFLLVRSTRSALVFLAVAILVGAVVPGLLAALFEPAFAEMDDFIVSQFWRWSVPSQLACFAFGMLLYFLMKEHRLTALEGTAPALLLLGAAAVLCGFAVLRMTPLPQHHVFAAGFMLGALALSRRPFPLLVNRATVFMGRISYSGYLLHFLVLVQLMPLLREAGLGPFSAMGLGFLLGTAVTAPLAWASFRLIEQPSTRLARAIVNRLEARGPLAATTGG